MVMEKISIRYISKAIAYRDARQYDCSFSRRLDKSFSHRISQQIENRLEQEYIKGTKTLRSNTLQGLKDYYPLTSSRSSKLVPLPTRIKSWRTGLREKFICLIRVQSKDACMPMWLSSTVYGLSSGHILLAPSRIESHLEQEYIKGTNTLRSSALQGLKDYYPLAPSRSSKLVPTTNKNQVMEDRATRETHMLEEGPIERCMYDNVVELDCVSKDACMTMWLSSTVYGLSYGHILLAPSRIESHLEQEYIKGTNTLRSSTLQGLKDYYPLAPSRSSKLGYERNSCWMRRGQCKVETSHFTTSSSGQILLATSPIESHLGQEYIKGTKTLQGAAHYKAD
jgi:hypothetical protein